MFIAKVYRVMIGSLSGTMEDVCAVKNSIYKWNAENAESAGKLFLPQDWSVDVKADSLDVVIGIVGNWVRDIDFIDKCLSGGKKVLLFFNSLQDPNNTIPSEKEAVRAFRNKIQDYSICVDYNGTAHLIQLITDRLRLL